MPANDTQSRKKESWRKLIYRVGLICHQWDRLEMPERMYLLRRWRDKNTAEFYEVANESRVRQLP